MIRECGELDVGPDRENKNEPDDSDARPIDMRVLVSVAEKQRNAVDPHHGGGGVADHAPGAARVGGRSDRGEITDVHFRAEELVCHRTANEPGRNIIEKRREHPDESKEGEGTLPFVRQKFWQHHGHVTLLEMARRQRKAGQQAKQVNEDDPLVLEMEKEPCRARTGLKTGEHDLVERDRNQARESDSQGVMMKDRNAEQGQPEQNEIDGCTEQRRAFRISSEHDG